MRIAIIGSTAFDSLEYNLHEAFNFNGNECRIFDIYDTWFFKRGRTASIFKTLDFLGRRYFDKYDVGVFQKISQRILDYHPDLVIGVYRFIHPSLVRMIKKNGIKIIHVNPDALTTFEYQQLFVEPYDCYFTKDPYIVNFMDNNMKLNAKLYNEAFNIRVHKKPDVEKWKCEEEVDIDVMTYGTMYPYRTRMLAELLKHRINLKVYGVRPHRFYNHSLDSAFQDKYITGSEKSQLLYGAKIVFNQMHYAEIESVNNRFFEVNGAGAFQLSDYRPILKDLLPVDPELVSFRTVDEGIDKIKYYLLHPKERFEIASQVYDCFVEKYTYDQLVQYILNSI